jgi:hypothetical protein
MYLFIQDTLLVSFAALIGLYYCKNRRSKTAKYMLVVTFPITNGFADISSPTFDGIHTRNCCILQKVNPDVYYAMNNAKEKFCNGNQDNENVK